MLVAMLDAGWLGNCFLFMGTALCLENQVEFFNRPFSYSTKEPGSSVVFIYVYARGSIKWRKSVFY